MKKVFQTWKWALAVMLRSPLTVLAVAVIGALGSYGADLLSALPKPSGWAWLVAIVGALALGLVAVAVIASTVAAGAEAARQEATRIPLRCLLRFSRRQFIRCLITTVGAIVVSGLIDAVFGWVDHHTAGSTFRPLIGISLPSVQAVWRTFVTYAALVFVGFFISFLLSVVSGGWREAWGRARKLLADCAGGAPFWTNLLVFLVVGALVGALVNWVIWVQSEFWNDVQLVARAGVETLLLAGGYFFVLLSLARFTLLPEETAAPKAFQVWKSSLAVVLRSPLTVVVVAIVVSAWSFGAYRWLWLSESSIWALLLALVWGLLQIGVAVAFIAGVAVAVVEAASPAARQLTLKSLLHFNRSHFVRCLLMVTASVAFVLLLASLFNWVNEYALEVASFLTFRTEKPVSPSSVGNILSLVEILLLVAVIGLLTSFLLVLIREGWKNAARGAAGLVVMCLWSAPLWTTLLATIVFGGLSLLVSTYVPVVSAGFWDYWQMLLRMGVALLLLVFGWLFWMLSLARLSLPPAEVSSS